MEHKKGYYAGTEVSQKWWRLYKKPGFFVHGNGEYWYDTQYFYFQRYLTNEQLIIPFQKVSEIQIGRWHCGKWIWGVPFVKFIWDDDEPLLSSGFILSRSATQIHHICEELKMQLSAG